jgi:peptidoglycan/xylan/chitin deacetylase (PgdA/CDA1 family)
VRRLGLFVCAALAAFLAGHGSALAAQVRVSLTFDDGWASHETVASMLAAHGLKGTFYVNSGNVGQSGYLTWGQLTSFNAAGTEIAGHTLTHPDVTTLTLAEAQHEICDDRTAILGHGFVVPDFAYPFGSYDSTTGNGTLDASSVVRGCGYSSGRGAYGLHNITATNDTRPYATSIPPPNMYKILTACCINTTAFGGSTPTAAALESYVQHAVTEASPNPGWVIFLFHRICDNCGGDTPAPSMSPSEFDAFLGWLQSGPSGVDVRTVAQVVKNDIQAPTSSIACGGAACSSGWYGGPVSVSLSAADTGTAGVAMIRYTTDGSEPTAASPLYTGPFTVSATTTVKYRAWDNANNLEATKSTPIQIDTTAPASSITCDSALCSSGWYGGSVSVSLAAVDTESSVAVIRYTTDGTDPTASSPAYTAPFTVPSTTTVKYRAWDNAGNVEATNSQLIRIDTTAPSSSIACNGSVCSSDGYVGAVTVTLSANDSESGVAVIRYTLDGTDPTAASTAYSDPITISQTTTVKYRAWDAVGNVEATNSQVITVVTQPPDTDPPTSSIACNLDVCSAGWYGGTVSVSLSAADGGSGVAAIRYTTDGSTPTASSSLYTAPFSVSTTTTVEYRAWDVAGNVEATKSQLIQVDTFAPTVSIASPSGGATVTGNVKIIAAPADAQTGVASVKFYVDGVLVGTSTSAPWQFAWNTKKSTKGTHVLTVVATDRAGNSTTSAPVSVTVR